MIVKIIMAILGVAILVMSPPLFMFSMVALAPAMVAYIVDRVPGKNTSATVFYFNLAGIAMVSNDIKHLSTHDMGAVLMPMNLFTAYIFAAMGWFIVWLLPRITVIVTDYNNEKRAFALKEKIQKITEEWGPDIRGNN